MIDEKKLIEAITKGEYTTGNILADMELQQFIKDFPKIGEWIPCSERLPIICDVYNVTRKISEGKHIFYISDAVYFDGQNTWHSDNRVNHGREYLKDVIAWMPLPEPYKE